MVHCHAQVIIDVAWEALLVVHHKNNKKNSMGSFISWWDGLSKWGLDQLFISRWWTLMICLDWEEENRVG